MRLFFARHGESDGNARLLLFGRTDCPLTAQGREDARVLGEKLRGLDFRHCYASPLSRAADTARIALAGRDVPLTLMDGLMEQDMGEFENTVFDDMARRYPDRVGAMIRDWTSYTPPGGESYEELSERACGCLDKILERGEDALIVSHNGPLSAMFGRLLGTGGWGINAFCFKHGCWSSVVIRDGRVRLEYFNK